jgi:hypothetical protein
MTNIIVDIMVEVLTILGIATKEVKRGRFSESMLCRFTILELTDSSVQKVFEEVVREHRDRGQPAEAGQIDAR